MPDRDAVTAASEEGCPRCSTALEEFSRPAAEGGFAQVAMCVDCGGLWIPSGSLPVAFPELVAVVDTGVLEGELGDGACPACGRSLHHFVIEKLALDACAACRGLWIDGEEILPLEGARAAIRSIGERVHSGGYRTRAQSAVDLEKDRCAGCGRPMARGEGVEGAEGRLCRVCADAIADPIDPPVGLALRVRRSIRRLFGWP